MQDCSLSLFVRLLTLFYDEVMNTRLTLIPLSYW